MESREALVALNLVEHVGPVRVPQLLEHFGEAPAILRSTQSQSTAQRLVRAGAQKATFLLSVQSQSFIDRTRAAR